MTEFFVCLDCGSTYDRDVSDWCCNPWYDRSAPDDPYEE